jgi:hypothetical protein
MQEAYCALRPSNCDSLRFRTSLYSRMAGCFTSIKPITLDDGPNDAMGQKRAFGIRLTPHEPMRSGPLDTSRYEA